MLDTVKCQQLAESLFLAEQSRLAVAPITEELTNFSIEDAYAVQMHGIEARMGKTNRVVGKKIGLTSIAMQNLLGVFEPDYGHLLSDMEVVDGGTIRLKGLMQPKVEAEIAFLLKKDLVGPGVSTSDVIRATEAVVPSLEIVDSRVRDWRIKIQDTVADNASSARFVLGGRLTRVENLDLSLIGMVFKKNGEVISTAAGAAVLGHPAAAVAWLANKLGEYGITLKAGEVVLSGAFTAAVVPASGDYFEGCFDRLGIVCVRFGE